METTTETYHHPSAATMHTNSMIELHGIEKKYRTDTVETLALKHINLQIKKGEFVSIMGPSGCGKSTLLNIIGLLDKPSAGSVIIEGQQAEGLSDQKLALLRNRKLGFIFQSFHLINDLKVRDNVELPLLYRKMTNGERRSMAEHALEKVGLGHRMKHFPSQLSGGQKQRVAIARAMVGNPEIILADEPTGNLDSVMGNEIMDLMLQLNSDQHTTVVMVTHDEMMAKRTHRLIRLFDGTQVQ